MGLFNSIRSLVLGVDLEQVQRDEERALARTEELNRQKAERGQIDAAELLRRQQQIDRDRENAAGISAAVGEEFFAGIREGASNLGSAATSGLRGLLGSVPPLVWILLAVGVFLYFGGLKRVRAQLS